MNDRFRFRAWDNFEKKMISWDECLKNESLIAEFLLNAVRYNAMQCTGLKDKNGRLIYEGDIIIVDSSTINITDTQAIVFWDEYEASFNLQWLPQGNGANALKRIKKLSKHGVGDTRWWEIEIIGNIHENADLLKEKSEKPIL